MTYLPKAVRVGAALCALALCVGVARADQRTAELFGEADAAFAAEDLIEAAKRLGDAAAYAHSEGLLREERETLKRLRVLLSGVPVTGTKATSTRPVSRNDLIAAALQRLDPMRGGAHVSAHALSMLILIEGTTSGAPSLVGFASEALTRYSRAKGSGAGARMMADWARGLLVVEEHVSERAELVDAVKPLQSALDACVQQGWAEPATFIGLELASVLVQLERPNDARAALKSVAGLLASDDKGVLSVPWSRLAATRLRDAPRHVLGPVVALVAPLRGGARTIRGPKGGVGGKGRSAGYVPPVLRFMRKARTEKAVARVERGAQGFEVSVPFEPEFERVVKPEIHEQAVNAEGVVVVCHAAAVALAYLDETGGGGTIGESSRRSPWLAWYFVGRDEEWRLTTRGRVVIAK